MTTTSQPVTLVLGAGDSKADTDFLFALGSLERGVLVAQAKRSGGRRDAPLFREVAAALGKPFELTGSRSVGRRLRALVQAWLIGERVQHLVIGRAQNLHLEQWRAAVALASACDTHLWFIVHGRKPTAGQESVLGPDLTQRTFSEFKAAISSPPGRATGRLQDSALFPTVPRTVEFPTFWSSCLTLLDQTALARVDQVFQQVAATVQRAGIARSLKSAPETTQRQIASLARHLLDATTSIDESITTVRVLQVELIKHGWGMKVDLDRFVATQRRVPAPPLTPEIAMRIRMSLNTGRAAAALLRIACGLEPDELCRLTLADITPHGVRVNGNELPLPFYGEGILRAHQVFRQLEAASDGDPYFVAYTKARRPTAVSQKRIRAWLDAVASETGLSFGPYSSSPRLETNEAWAQRHGISASPLFDNDVFAIGGTRPRLLRERPSRHAATRY